MTDLNSPHDALFRKVLEDPESLAAILHERLPAEAVADFAGPPRLVEATHIDGDTLARTTSDGLAEVPTRSGPPGFANALLEHKSSPEARLLLTLLKRMLGIWEEYAQDDAGRMETLPVVYVLLFYHGARPWDLPSALDLVFPEGDGWLGLRLRILAVDLTKLPPDQLSASAFAQAAFYAMLYACGHLSGFEALVEAMRQMPDDLYFATPLMTYMLNFEDDSRVAAALQIAKPETGGKIMMTGAQKFRAEGRTEGEAKILARQLEHRFGTLAEDARSRLAQASEAELETWSLRLLSADSLAAVFSPPAPQ